MIGIYKITSPTNKVYIGQTTNYDKRYSAYKNHKCKGQPKLFNSLNKYGFDTHQIDLIRNCSLDELNHYERHYQEYYNSVVDGLNLRYTATNSKSGYMSEESKKKMSESRKGIIFNDEWKANLAKVWIGRKHTEETKLKMSNAGKGKKKSAEHIAKLWQNQKGAIMPKRSEETKMLQSLNNGKSKAVIQMDLDGNFIAEFRSASEAVRIVNISRNIGACCLGKLETSGGYKWKFKG